MRILILCTGNSCRSQMAEGFLRTFNPALEVYSAGTSPATYVQRKAIAVMKEAGINLGDAFPKHVDSFIHESFDFVITVCDNARETCPLFTGKVRHRVHIGFDDPSEARGTDQAVMAEFRRVRDEIRDRFHEFYITRVLPQLTP
jgi:arsenate reductase